MKRVVWLALIAAATWSACAQSTPEQQMINDAAAALGGSDRIQAVKTLTIEGEGTNGNLGQDVQPEATSQTFNVTGYKRVVDVAAGRARIEQTRTPTFTYFQGQGPQKQVLGIDGNVGYNVAANGAARSPASPSMVCFITRRSAVVYLSVFVVRRAGSRSPLTS